MSVFQEDEAKKAQERKYSTEEERPLSPFAGIAPEKMIDGVIGGINVFFIFFFFVFDSGIALVIPMLMGVLLLLCPIIDLCPRKKILRMFEKKEEE